MKLEQLPYMSYPAISFLWYVDNHKLTLSILYVILWVKEYIIFYVILWVKEYIIFISEHSRSLYV